LVVRREADFFDACVVVAAPARCAAHRFLSALTMFRLPSADSFRFGFLLSAVASDDPFFAAHRRF
jgi:hypothetical protein